MCRSKAQGGRRCRGKSVNLNKTVEKEAVTVTIERDRSLNEDTPTFNRLLTIAASEWYALSWTERKRIVEQAFREANRATGSYARWGGWNRRTSALGITISGFFYDPPVIELSDVANRHIAPANIADTLAHELAHAKAGGAAGHGPVWHDTFKALRDSLGLQGDIHSTHSDSDAERQEQRKLAAEKRAKPPVWLGLCPQGHRFGAGRKPTRNYLCVQCHRDGRSPMERIITYTRNTNKEAV